MSMTQYSDRWELNDTSLTSPSYSKTVNSTGKNIKGSDGVTGKLRVYAATTAGSYSYGENTSLYLSIENNSYIGITAQLTSGSTWTPHISFFKGWYNPSNLYSFSKYLQYTSKYIKSSRYGSRNASGVGTITLNSNYINHIYVFNEGDSDISISDSELGNYAMNEGGMIYYTTSGWRIIGSYGSYADGYWGHNRITIKTSNIVSDINTYLSF